MLGSQSTFRVVHEGRAFAPQTIRCDGLLLGQHPSCDLILSDPSMPAVVAGIKEIEDRFYLVRIKASPFEQAKPYPITINGSDLADETVLADEDLVVIGDYWLKLDRVGEALHIKVTHPEEELTLERQSPGPAKPLSEPAKPDSGKAAPNRAIAPRTRTRLAEWSLAEWAKRQPFKSRQKVARFNYLKPQSQKLDLKSQYNWAPTRDLTFPWPRWFLFATILGIGALAVVAYLARPTLFAPGQVSRAHTQAQLTPMLLIAARSNQNSCLQCHSLRGTVDDNCATCHQAERFHASITKQHRDAGIGCRVCHTEHKGAGFDPKAAALDSCVACHNDNNKQTYNGKAVYTAHGGTFGYPAKSGFWIWAGLDAEALQLKPEVAQRRLPSDTELQWRSKQFHAIHLTRVKIAPGLEDVKDGVLQCPSCHKRQGSEVDRDTPRQTCGKCHNGYVDPRTGRALVASNTPNCVSCHVQHYYDSYRWGDLLTEPEQDKRRRAQESGFLDAVKRSATP
jgi:hypothetical protein